MPRSSFLVEGVLTKLCRICIIPEEPALSGLKDWEIRRLEGSKAEKLKSSKAQKLKSSKAQKLKSSKAQELRTWVLLELRIDQRLTVSALRAKSVLRNTKSKQPWLPHDANPLLDGLLCRVAFECGSHDY
jgi:hypothetical protein